MLHVACDRQVVVSDLFEARDFRAPPLLFLSECGEWPITNYTAELTSSLTVAAVGPHPTAVGTEFHAINHHCTHSTWTRCFLISLLSTIIPSCCSLLLFECLDLVFMLAMVTPIAPSTLSRCENIHVGRLDLSCCSHHVNSLH